MLILFSTVETLDMPDLHVKDSEDNTNIPVAGIEGWDDDYIQVVALCNAPCNLLGPGIGLVVSEETSEYYCRRLSKINISPEFSTSGATAKIRLKFKDNSDRIFITPELDLIATSIQNGSLYIGEHIVVETYGAKSVKAIVTSISTGTVALYLAGI